MAPAFASSGEAGEPVYDENLCVVGKYDRKIKWSGLHQQTIAASAMPMPGVWLAEVSTGGPKGRVLGHFDSHRQVWVFVSQGRLTRENLNLSYTYTDGGGHTRQGEWKGCVNFLNGNPGNPGGNSK